ncbi:MAG: hypothetical protein FWB96_00600 [Defluviitaleaceae bacterium]|nr:hypothetical protein [Defluviitaleaceae bacterium]MCL2261787.1 hypothetical protein [Defluviitaleaceae bacterium]
MKLILLILLVAFLPTANAFAAVDNFTATFHGRIVDAGEETTTADHEDASITFSFGEETILFMRFDEPVSFMSDYARITTNIPVIGTTDALSTGARLTNFILDGNEVQSAEIFPTMGGDGFLVMAIGGNEYSMLTGTDPFTTLEIHFLVANAPTGAECPEYEPAEVYDITETSEYIGDPPNENGRRGLPIAIAFIVGAIFAPAIIGVIKKVKSRK